MLVTRSELLKMKAVVLVVLTVSKAAPYKVNVLDTLLLNRLSNEVLKQAGGDGHSSESPG